MTTHIMDQVYVIYVRGHREVTMWFGVHCKQEVGFSSAFESVRGPQALPFLSFQISEENILFYGKNIVGVVCVVISKIILNFILYFR